MEIIVVQGNGADRRNACTPEKGHELNVNYCEDFLTCLEKEKPVCYNRKPVKAYTCACVVRGRARVLENQHDCIERVVLWMESSM